MIHGDKIIGIPTKRTDFIQMVEISILQKEHESVIIGNNGFDSHKIFYLDITVYVSNRGIILSATGGGEDNKNNTSYLNWGNRMLKIGDKIAFNYLSQGEITNQVKGGLLKNLKRVDIPKCAFYVTTLKGDKIECNNLNSNVLQFELRWDNVSNNCLFEVWNGNMKDNGEINIINESHGNIKKRQTVTLEIQALTNHIT